MVPLASDARVLIVTVARIGDTLLATPVMRAARAAVPRGELTVLAHPDRLQVLRGLPFIDELRAITKHRARWLGWFGGRMHALAMVYGRDPALARFALRVATRAVAFASDVAPHWAPPEFMSWPHYADLWASIVRWAAGGRVN